MPTQIVLKEKQQDDGFLTCLETHHKRKAGQREVCDLSYSHVFGLKNMEWVLGGHQLECFLHKSSSSALHPPPPSPGLPGAPQEPITKVFTVHTEGPPSSCSGWECACLYCFLSISYTTPDYWGNKLALQKSFRTFLWHMTNSPTLIHGRWRYYQWALVPFPTELGQERGAGWEWGAPGCPGVYH